MRLALLLALLPGCTISTTRLAVEERAPRTKAANDGPPIRLDPTDQMLGGQEGEPLLGGQEGEPLLGGQEGEPEPAAPPAAPSEDADIVTVDPDRVDSDAADPGTDLTNGDTGDTGDTGD